MIKISHGPKDLTFHINDPKVNYTFEVLMHTLVGNRYVPIVMYPSRCVSSYEALNNLNSS
jgi:hypothetical protein